MGRWTRTGWSGIWVAIGACGSPTPSRGPVDAAGDPAGVDATPAPRIRISEFMPEPRRSEPRVRFDGANGGPYTEEADDDALQYIELVNRDAVAVDLSGWVLDGGVDYTFAAGTVLAPGAYLVVARDPDRLAQVVGVAGAHGPWQGRLRHSGELFALREPGGRVVERVDYTTLPPWPVLPGSGGAALERVVIDDDRTGPANWRSSTQALAPPAVGTGSPGAPNSVVADAIAPFVSDLTHSPPTPAAGEPVAITARVESDVALTAVEAWVTSDLEEPPVVAPMFDDGAHDDGAAGDGVWGTTLAGAPARTLRHFRVHAVSTGGTTTTYPYDDEPAPTRAYYHHGAAGGRYHLFLAQADVDALQAAAQASPREDRDATGTLVIDGVAYPHVRVSLAGRWPRATPPFAWHFRLNPDHTYRGLTSLRATAQAADVQHAVFAAFATAGVPSFASEVGDLDLTTETSDGFWARYVVFEAPNGRWLETYGYPDDSELYKARSCESGSPRRNADLYYFGDAGDERADNGLQTDANYWGAYGSATPWAPPDGIRELVAALGDLSDADLLPWLDAHVDLDRWLRAIALHLYLRLDDFACHNYYLVRPSGGGKWHVLSYDFDAFGRWYVLPTNYAARQDVRESPDWQRNRLHERIATNPTLRRIFLLSIRRLIDEFPPQALVPEPMIGPVDEARAALTAELLAADLPPPSAAPTVAPCGGVVAAETPVAVTATAGWTPYYTVDGTDPRLSPTRLAVAGPIVVAPGLTLRAAAAADGNPLSDGQWTDRVDCAFAAPP